MADVNSTFKVYITNEPVFNVYVNNGAKGDSGTNGTDGVDGEGVASGGFTGQFLIKLSEEDFDTGWSNIDSTQVSYGDGTVSEGLDNRYTKGETDLLLDDKSDVGHTHDDRYFTETEVGVLLSGKSDTSHTHDGRYYTETETDALLSGKSDTTHNHDLTYAPIVHNHDDIYYTDDEVDTLLLSKSDTTHTHDLIKNATEANAKIEASSTGAVITRNVVDGATILTVQSAASSWGRLAEFKIGSVIKAFISGIGAYQTDSGMANYGFGADHAYVKVPSTGTEISRNVADANPALKVNQQNASSTGKILDLQFGGMSVANVDKTGNIGGTALYVGLNGGIFGSMIAQGFNLGSTVNRPRIYRNVADALPAITIDQQNASSTGNIAEFQFNGTTKLAIDKNGLIPQEAWITATLLAGATGNALYRKTQIGQLEIVIDITVGTATAGTTVFALPTAYKITKSTFAYLRNETTTGIVGFLFNFNGNCIILSGISTGQRMTGLITVPFYNS